MRRTFIAVAFMTMSSFAFAATPGGVQATSGGVNIQGATNISANAEDTNAVASGGSVAKNKIGAIKGGTNIQGNTNINANAKNTNAVATGGSTATNDIGTIGGE
jgi:hypothetical protein